MKSFSLSSVPSSSRFGYKEYTNRLGFDAWMVGVIAHPKCPNVDRIAQNIYLAVEAGFMAGGIFTQAGDVHPVESQINATTMPLPIAEEVEFEFDGKTYSGSSGFYITEDCTIQNVCYTEFPRMFIGAYRGKFVGGDLPARIEGDSLAPLIKYNKQ